MNIPFLSMFGSFSELFCKRQLVFWLCVFRKTAFPPLSAWLSDVYLPHDS